MMLLAAPFTLAAVLAAGSGEMAPSSDWGITVEGANYLLSGHLSVYADKPYVQMGPLALLPGALPGLVYMLSFVALLPLLLWVAVLPDRTPRAYRQALVGGTLLAWPWAALAVQGHGDEALVALGLVVMVSALRMRREAWVVLGFMVAVAGKPTAILLLPAAFAHSRRTGLAALVGGGLVWAPFVLADVPGFLAAGQGQGDLWEYSLPDLVGGEPHTGFPQWVRPVQLAGGLALCWLLARRGSVVAAVAAACGFRVLLEPGTWNYYATVDMVAGLDLDLTRPSRAPWLTLLGFVSFLATIGLPPLTAAQGAVRLVALAGVLAATVWLGLRERAEPSAPAAPVELEPAGRLRPAS